MGVGFSLFNYIYFSIRDESLEKDDKYKILDDFNLYDIQGDLSAIDALQEYSQFSEFLFWHGYSQLVDSPKHYHGKELDSKFSNIHVNLQSFGFVEFWLHRACTNPSGETFPFLSFENTVYSPHGLLSMKNSKNENLNNKCFEATVHKFVQKWVMTSFEKPTDSKQANAMPTNVQKHDSSAKNELME